MTMNEQTISADTKLQEAFRLALGTSPEADVSAANYGETDGWDSAAHMALIAEVEGAFDVMLDTDEVIGMSSFAVARQILTKYGVHFED